MQGFNGFLSLIKLEDNECYFSIVCTSPEKNANIVLAFNGLYFVILFLDRIPVWSHKVPCFFSLLREILSSFSDSKANLQKVSLNPIP